MAWMVYDDYSRGWKSYQKEFQRLEAEKTHAQIDAAEKALDKETLDSLLKQRSEAVAAATQHAKDLEEAQRKLREIETVAYRDDLGYRTTKSTFDAKKFDYEEAAHRGSSRAQQIKKEMDDLQKELEDLRVKGLLHEQEKTDAQAVIAGINGRIAETDKKIADLEAGVDRLKKNLDKVEPSGLMKVAIDLLNAPLLDFVAPSLKKRQVVLEKAPLAIHFARVPRADRCQTCHLSSDRAGFEAAEQPYRTHTKLNLFLGGASPPPVDKFGCTPCHRGRDRAVDFLYAVHQPDSEDQKKEWEAKYGWKHDHYWEHPMLARRRTEASCLKCHQGVVSVSEAEHLNRAIELVHRYGCYACHKMRGFENRPKVAPPLTHPTAKLTPEWMARWIKDPKAFRPSTRMPRFFGLRNNQGPGDVEREDAEVVGIVAYLTEKAEKRSYPSLPGRGEPERGRKLVKSIGCMGCHAIERDEVQAEVLQARNSGQKADPIAWERRFGPDLSRIGSKARPEWIYQWILNPRQYNPETRMPSLRLTSQEALDITAYLMTLTDDTPDDRRAGAGRPQPAARNTTLLAYLSQ